MAVCLGPRGDSELKKQGKEQEERSAGSICCLSSCLKQINLPAKKTSYVNCPFYFRSCDALEGIFLFVLLKDYSFVSNKDVFEFERNNSQGYETGQQANDAYDLVSCVLCYSVWWTTGEVPVIFAL